jgi:hypothetical protein
MVDSGFEELNFDEAELVVEALELAKKVVDQTEGFVVGLLSHLECYQADLEVLSLKSTALGGGPFYTVLGDGDFDIGAVGDFLDEVEQLADYVTMLAGCEALAQDCCGVEDIPNLADLAFAKEENTVLLSLTRFTSSCVFFSSR